MSHVDLPSAAGILSFRRRVLTAMREKLKNSPKLVKKSTRCRISRNAEIAKSFVIPSPKMAKIENPNFLKGATFATNRNELIDDLERR